MRSLRRRAAACLTAATIAATTSPFAVNSAFADETGVAPAPSAAPTEPPQPAPVPAPPAPPPLTPQQIRHQKAEALRRQLVLVAKRKMRTSRYVYGASGPNAFDCSGFTQWLYRAVARKRLAHYTGAQMRQTRRVSLRHLLPGDLLFFGPGGSQHVTMYIGRGRMIGASNPRVGIRIDSIHAPWYRPKLAGVGRVLTA